MFNNRALVGAAAAVLVVALAGGTYLVLRGQNASVGASPSPGASPSAGPQASAADPIAAYRTARNQVCMAAVQAFTDNNDLAGLYDPSTPPDQRAIANANAQDIADAMATMAADLAKLDPPAELAEAHTTDVAHAQAQAAIFAAQSQLLRDGRYTDAAAQEVAAEAASNLRRPFETEYNLFKCP